MHCSHWGHDGHLAICFQVRKKPGKSMHRPGISVNCAVPVCRRDSNSAESIDPYIWLPELDTRSRPPTTKPLREASGPVVQSSWSGPSEICNGDPLPTFPASDVGQQQFLGVGRDHRERLVPGSSCAPGDRPVRLLGLVCIELGSGRARRMPPEFSQVYLAAMVGPVLAKKPTMG